MSIVAGLIIGDAAVASGLISTPMLTVTAIAVIAGFVVPDLAQSITLLRLAFLPQLRLRHSTVLTASKTMLFRV